MITKYTKETYVRYLQSGDWKRKRREKLEEQKVCEVCGTGQLLRVHHLEYRNWYDVLPSDLCVLCENCHNLGHELISFGVVCASNGSIESRRNRLKKAIREALGIEASFVPSPNQMSHRCAICQSTSNLCIQSIVCGYKPDGGQGYTRTLCVSCRENYRDLSASGKIGFKYKTTAHRFEAFRKRLVSKLKKKQAQQNPELRAKIQAKIRAKKQARKQANIQK
jgi:hypothetical protein